MMSTCCIIVVVIIIALLAAYTQRRWLARMWSSRPVVVLAPRNPAIGGDDYRDSEDDIYGNFDDSTYGGGPFRLRISDPEYGLLLDGKKTIEARPDKPPFNRIKTGETITVVRARPKGDLSEFPGGQYKHESTVTRITKYPSLEALLKTEGVTKVYPGKSATEATARFSMYLPQGATPSDPVMAIELKIAKGAAAKK